MWGSLENIYLTTIQAFQNEGEDLIVRHTVFRYSRAVMKALFSAANNRDDLSDFFDSKLLTEIEVDVPSEVFVGTRPLVILGSDLIA